MSASDTQPYNSNVQTEFPFCSPHNHLPQDSSNLLVITGQFDQILKPGMTSELRVSAQNRHAKVFDGKAYAHPFMDRSFEVHAERMAMILEFLDDSSESSLSLKTSFTAPE